MTVQDDLGTDCRGGGLEQFSVAVRVSGEGALEVGSDVSAGCGSQLQGSGSVTEVAVGLFRVRESLTVLYPGEHQGGANPQVGGHVGVGRSTRHDYVHAGGAVGGAAYPLEVTTPAASDGGQVTTTVGGLVVSGAAIAHTVAHGVVRDAFGYFVGFLETLELFRATTVTWSGRVCGRTLILL